MGSRNKSHAGTIDQAALQETISSLIVPILKSQENMFKALMETQQKALESLIRDLSTASEKRLETKISALEAELFITNQQKDQMNTQLTKLQRDFENQNLEIHAMHRDIEKLKQDLDDLEQYGRKNCLIIHGLNYEEGQSDKQAFMSFVTQHMPATKLEDWEIGNIHQLPSTTGRTKPIIVKFISHIAKDRIYKQRSKLKNTNIYLTESLTKRNGDLYARCRQHLATRQDRNRPFSQLWTNDGKIFVRCGETVKQIKNTTDIVSLLQ